MGSIGSRRVLAGALGAVLLLTSPAVAKPSDARRARVAVRNVVSHQKDNGSIPAFSPVGSTADAVVAMVAARRAPSAIDRALDFLAKRVRTGKVETVGLTAKVVIAAVAGGRDPKRFGGENLVRKIKRSVRPSGRLGKGTPVFEHALGLLALMQADSVFLTKSVVWLTDAQCEDGGWQYDRPARPDDDEHCLDSGQPADAFQSDTNTTSLAVQVLAHIEEGAPPLAVDPFDFFAAIRDEVKRGWGYSWGLEITDANSTSLVLQAFAARGLDPPTGARRALRRLQYGFCGANRGAFAFTWIDPDEDGNYRRSGADVGATIGAIPGLLGRPLPIAPAEVTKPAPRPEC